jgi:hypothetical protein
MRTFVGAVIVLIVLAGYVPRALAQPGAWEGKFAATAGGAVWVIVGGERHRVQAVQITDEELAQFPEGAPVASIDQLGHSPAAAVPAPLASPPETLLGQTVRVCRKGVPLTVQVVEADWTRQLGSGAGSTVEGGMWVSVVASVTNNGRDSESLYEATRLRDERGRTWEDVAGRAAAVHTDYEDRATQRGAQVANRGIRPGIATRVLLVFNVAEDAGRLELSAIDGSC